MLVGFLFPVPGLRSIWHSPCPFRKQAHVTDAVQHQTPLTEGASPSVPGECSMTPILHTPGSFPSGEVSATFLSFVMLPAHVVPKGSG